MLRNVSYKNEKQELEINELVGKPFGLFKRIKDGGVGYSCIAEIRMVETILKGKPLTPFMKFGDETRIEMKDKNGLSIFGEIRQIVKQLKS